MTNTTKVNQETALICRPLEGSEVEAWDRLVEVAPEGTLFHTSLWLRTSGLAYAIYGVFRAGELLGGAAFIARKVGPFRVAGHPPLTPYLGAVVMPTKGKYVSDLSFRKQVTTAIATSLKGLIPGGALKMAPEVTDLQPFIWNGFTVGVRYTYRLPLGDLPGVWANMETTRRNHIRKAEADGLWVDDQATIDEVLALVQETFARQGMSAAFIDSAIRYDGVLKELGRCRAFVTRNRDGQGISAVYIVWDWKRAYCLLGGYSTTKRHRGAGALAMWHAIRFAADSLQLREFDFEGSMIPSIEQYFRSFGGKLTPYYTISWSTRSLRYAVSLRQGIGTTIRSARGLLSRFLLQTNVAHRDSE